MKYRTLGKTNFKISEVSFGSWAIGGTWGDVEDETSLKALEEAIANGVNFFDTADVYGDGRSERLIGKLKKSVKQEIYIATKAGRRLNPHVASGYNKENITEFINRSLKNLEVETLDLLQLHCPPTEVYYEGEIFTVLDEIKKQGKILNYGVSVEKVEEALKAIEYNNVATVQIIYNMFRHKPNEDFFKKADDKNVGIIVRVPLASGMLTGKMTKNTHFASDDHRQFNRQGESFDKGETFSGVDYNLGLEAVEVLKKIKPVNITMAQFALKWILQNRYVSCVIPGGKTEVQVKDNTQTSELSLLTEVEMDQVKVIYEKYIKNQVHHLW